MSANRPTAAQNPSQSCPKAVVSVSEMARVVMLSRSRFYSLVEQGIFPSPVYLIRSRRPVYTADLQQACLDVRQRGIGFQTGEPVLFYERRVSTPRQASSSPRKTRTAAKTETPITPEVARLLDGLKQLGMTEVKPAEATAAIADCFPDGVEGVEAGAVLAAVFRRLRASG